MILNLVTRKSLWMRSTTIETQVKEKAAGQTDLENLDAFKALEAQGMTVENDRLLIQYEIVMTNRRPKRVYIG